MVLFWLIKVVFYDFFYYIWKMSDLSADLTYYQRNRGVNRAKDYMKMIKKD